ncbi:MAG: hypothetical protein CBB68_10820 [Rhodospirillaceae bacterium TMED8]|nr:MAG: hypothetical protein CBB68_10820 [Rhodospirillaceae bacterium TMED8]
MISPEELFHGGLVLWFATVIEPQEYFRDMAYLSAQQNQIRSPVIRESLNAAHTLEHPEKPDIRGLSHIIKLFYMVIK